MLMGTGIMKKSLDYCADLFRGCRVEIEHHLQTNLLLYEKEWADIIDTYFKGNISSSMDFPNLYRNTANLNSESYTEHWMQKKLQAERDGMTVNLITLPNNDTLKMGAVPFYSFFTDSIGVQNLQINLPFPGTRKGFPERMDLGALADFLEELNEVWIKSGRSINLNPFKALEDRVCRANGRLPCAWSFSCANYLFAVSPDLDVALCDCWVSTLKQFNYGRIGGSDLSAILGSENRRLFLQRPGKIIMSEDCGHCDYWAICYGGCPVRAYTFSGQLNSKDYYCTVYKRLFALVSNGALERGKSDGARQRLPRV
jgi:radical SAM protein with 4Fe4S-binding SPASM domain